MAHFFGHFLLDYKIQLMKGVDEIQKPLSQQESLELNEDVTNF